MAKCSFCGTEIASGARFCLSCGKPVENSDDMATIDFATSPLPPPPRPPSSSSRNSSSGSSSSAEFLLTEGRFLPGRLIIGRYRIIALLGKGGMGEVYRADDLTLGQAVAMKFLPDETTRDAAMLERFRNEVRIARRISHPNVCRVYDVGDVDGQAFFTMEYIDGEDLASLLRRIGRLPPDKALEIARQLCAGLAAAHAKGVLHRDLKPANIMLDGRGQVVITDFGLAGVAHDIRGPEVRSGTPAYMAPEQIAGKEVSPRSDIYALGLVLYEIFTGKRAFAEKAGIGRARGDRTPSRPSSVVKDFDPIVEKVILRCLEEEPSARPANVLSVAGALPGGDPLAAALAAGETPSPQMVAAAGETTGLRPAVAVACLATVIFGFAIGIALTIHYSAIEKMHLDQTPEVLEHKAREVVSAAGYADKPADSAFSFDYDTNYSDYVDRHDPKPVNWDQIISGRPTMLEFWYRQSPDLMSASDYRDILLTPGIIAEEDPPTTLSGMVNVKLDAHGRLIYLQAIPPQKEAAGSTSARPPDWAPLFSAAELDPLKLQAAQPEWTSLGSSDTRLAWTGAWPGTNRALRVEAASWRGKPVFFALIGEWNKPWRMITPKSQEEKRNRAGNIISILLLMALLVAGSLLARRNYRRGRGDREGAFRLAVVMFILEMLLFLCRSHFVPGFETLGTTMLAIASGLLLSSVGWVFYMAIEPWIRRQWPQAIITWARLISGQVRDPLVGRDILFGVTFGAVWIMIIEGFYILSSKFGGSPPLAGSAYLLGGRQALGQFLIQVPTSIFATLQFFFLLLGLKVLVEFLFGLVKVKVAYSDWIAGFLFLAFWVTIRSLGSNHPQIDIPELILIYGVLVVIVLRFGLVPLALGAFTVDMLANVPFTADFSAWYLPTTVLALLGVVAITVWGFYHSLGGQPVWKVEME